MAKQGNKKGAAYDPAHTPWTKLYEDAGLSWDAAIDPKPIYTLFDEAVEKFPNRTALNFFGKKYTYQKLGKLVNRAAKGFQELGIKKGTKIGLLMPNCPQYIISYFAILKVGGVVVNFNPLYTIKDLKREVEDLNVTVMVTLNLNVLYGKANNLLRSTPLEKIIVGKFQRSLPFIKGRLFSLLKREQLAAVLYGKVNVSFGKVLANDGNYKPVTINPTEDIAALQYTGGTTGIPKGAILTHSNIYSNARQCLTMLGGMRDGEERILAVLPFFHIFALTAVLSVGIAKGAELLLHPKFELQRLMEDLVRLKPTVLVAVPAIFTAINNYPGADTHKQWFSSLRFAVSGGAALPVPVKERFEQLTGCAIYEGYGLTESSPVATLNPLFAQSKAGSIGVPLPDTMIGINDLETKAWLPQGGTGEICIKGPQVMQGYWNATEEVGNPVVDGWLHTGDVGYVDEQGYVFIVDRLKEVIISGGTNIYPRKIETAILENSKVKEAAAIPMNDAYRGQAVRLVLVLRDGEEMTVEDVGHYLESKLAKFELPRAVEFRKELPKTMIGKIDKKALLAEGKE